MKKFISLVVASSVLAMAPLVQAATPVYTPSLPWSLDGIVAVNKGVALSCLVTLDIDSAGATIVLAPNPASPGGLNTLCPSVLPDHVPSSDIDYDATSKKLTLKNVFIQTVTAGDCQGDIVGTWDVATQTLSVAGSMPAATAGAPCTMNGVLDLLSPTGGDIN
ncbi:hypothetical protein [Sphingopyxis yananensis]|uniref:hypothetical protein n=1 Tax=Sphingopyxis yananensis TaxID=2886687 RepID=UPI001D109062|nr:hypothetical protein [Sphingopyxis yananensis]MCC2600878.1 hypothetical protein [Sphingopyxis yananensis]